MKIKIESEKIIQAVRNLDGIEIVLETPDDAKEAFNLILRKTDIFGELDVEKLKDVTVTSLQRYETSAVDYKRVFLLEFLFQEDVPLDRKVAFIKALQTFFDKV